jgi:hypothetical protein
MEAAPASTDGQEQPAEEPPGCRCDIPGEYDKFTFAKTRARESGRQIFVGEAVHSEEEAFGSTWNTFSSGLSEADVATHLLTKLQTG